MNLHDRYLRFPTLDISILRAVDNKSEDDVVPHHLLQFYNHELTKENLNISKLEAYRMLLCYEYQQTFSEVEKYDNQKCIVSDAKKICFPSMEAVFPAQHPRSVAEMSILRDIIILQMVLYCNTVFIKQHLQNFLNSYDVYSTNSDTRTMYMKVLEYFLESLCLHSHNDGSSNKEELEEIGSMYLEIVKSWMKTKEDSEWGVFASMFPMLVNTFAPEHVLFPLWEHVLTKMDDLKEFLTALSIMVDTCFTSLHSTKSTCIYRDIFCKNTFWLLLLLGLRSPLQQYRKQALYIMRRVIDFMSNADNSHLKSMKAPITPFICNRSDNSGLSVDSIKDKFFLVYESLEEKQHHLVAPALTHVTSLAKASKEHESCQCFSIVWLQCILEKALRHENNNIAKWSVFYVLCELDNVVFDDQFLELFVNSLNNSFLYECQPKENSPKILRKLGKFFRSAKKETNLLNRFFKKVSEVTWGPVAIFYILHMLQITLETRHLKIPTTNVIWRAAELNAVKSLAETNLAMHSYVLRTASQTELLQTIPNVVRKIDDLTLLANVLAAFPLTRGRFPWDVITTWLQEILTKEDAVAFVEQTCAKYSSESLVPEVSPKTFALMVVLLYDASRVLSCRSCPAENALNNWLSCLNGIEMRPYADIHSTIDAMEFLSHLMNFWAQKETNDCQLNYLIRLYVHATVKFHIGNLKKIATRLTTFEDYTRYEFIMSSHIANPSFTWFMPERDMFNYMVELQEESIRLLRDTDQRQSMQYLYGMCILYLSNKIWKLPLAENFYMKYLKDPEAIPIQASDRHDADAMNLKGKIASKYYLILSQMTTQYLTSTLSKLKSTSKVILQPKLVSCPNMYGYIPFVKMLTGLLKFIELGGMETVIEVTRILVISIENNFILDTTDWETFTHVFRSCWRCTFASKKNAVFWTAIQNLTEAIINNNFLMLEFGDTTEFVTEFVDQLMKEGENAPKFKRILLSRVKSMGYTHLEKPFFVKLLLNFLLHGSVLRRDERVENHARSHIIKDFRQYFPSYNLIVDYNNDAEIRALATMTLLTINLHSYATVILPFIFKTLKRHKNKRYFNDSQIHKLKHRLMQVLLILEPVMSKELVALLQKRLQDSILSESNQHSVRLMQEWLMIRILIRYSDLHDELWKFYAESIKNRPGCTISAAGIVYHVARFLSDDSQETFIRTALPYVAQCCLGQQFNMRLYNQFVLVRLCDMMKQRNNGDSISDYNGIHQTAMASLQQASSMKNFARIQEDFYFSCFHPIDDYSLQTIYFELPRLTNVSCDEWIKPVIFKDFNFVEGGICRHPLKLYNINSLLSKTTTSMYLMKSFADDAESLVIDVETYVEGLQNIQRKMDPSKFIAPLYRDNFGAIEENRLNLHEEGLIIVASFVNRPPNLGGIARTCEIFGVKLLVIANLDCIKDKEFQCLSVSAERWINVLQVKQHELQQYLLEKKNAGWSLIGVEQTANSVNLLEMKFEKKTILILGNEKDGIPANFIPLFDTCVEIPQAGVIRSLNVHVTAAICIWQYASQHTLK